tara:strand:+ start:17616 stop:17870 length:255 start_codon:yes stop_codon:yes gene_type:complete
MTVASNDRLKILSYLRAHGSLTTLAARNELGIMHPGGRVHELRKQGFNIVTYDEVEIDPANVEHCVAKYALFNKKEEVNDQKST